ncbi:MAG: lytic transglycosylase domain-containing protein [Gammaproteobacteria bacterium]
MIKLKNFLKLHSLLFYSALIFLVVFSTKSFAAGNNLSWNTWLQNLRTEAISQGIQPELFDAVFFQMTPDPSVLSFNKHQPEKRLTFMQYRKTRIDPFRIKLGRSKYERYQDLLQSIGYSYGVDPCFITALWGMETSYGNYLGHFSVPRSLATLAYATSRADYFHNELLIALHILSEGHVSLDKFKGEWAGASGQPQFMPSSWQKYAVDYDGDGHKNIWTSYSDAFASIANYLKMNGWHQNQPWGLEVQVPATVSEDMMVLDHQMPISKWLQMGVRPTDESKLPANYSMLASVIRPTGGPTFMVFNNFKVIMKYNNSIFYAASIGYLADNICNLD